MRAFSGVTAAFLLLTASVPALAQAPAVPAPPPGPGETIVNLSATEHDNVQQDLLTASLNVERQNANPRTVQNEVNTLMQKAAAKGSVPLTFNITNIAPVGPAAASASITASGPHLAPTVENLTFVDQGGWKLSHDSAMTLIQSIRSSGH